MSPCITEYPVYFWQLINGFRARHEAMYAELRRRDTQFLIKDGPLRILDLGNGRLRPQYTLLKSLGHDVYGIDLANRPEISLVNSLYAIARHLYKWKSDIAADGFSDQTLVCGDVARLPFRSASFDLVTSIAAFEHFLDVPAVIEEVNRVLRFGGIVWACVHLFTCPSGAHNVTLTQIPLVKISRRVDPWDHLRQRKMKWNVPLNEWRRDEYVQAFSKHFEILSQYCAMREGANFLTPEIAAELSDYDADELTCLSYVIMARKPA